MLANTQGSPLRAWLRPAALALAVHALALALLVRVVPALPEASPGRPPEPIQVVFPPEEPERFTELPEDRADAAPEDPELLSNVDSRARDELAGGETSAPRLEGLATSPAVEIPEGDPAANDASTSETAEATEAASPEMPPTPEEEPLPEVLTDGSTPSRIGPAPAADSPAARRAGDVPQMALMDPDANTALSGRVSLNTVDWAYGDWMKAFRRHFIPNWRAPSGYKYMLIHGRTLVEVRIAPSGEMRHFEILAEEGHKALHEASARAFERATPFPPLPDDFPEEELVMRIELNYPKVWR